MTTSQQHDLTGSTVLAVDVSNLAHVAYWGTRSQDNIVSAINVALHQIAMAAARYRCTHVVCCYDHPPYNRAADHLIIAAPEHVSNLPDLETVMRDLARETGSPLPPVTSAPETTPTPTVSGTPQFGATGGVDDAEGASTPVIAGASAYKKDRAALEVDDAFNLKKVKEGIVIASSVLQLNDYDVVGAECDDLMYQLVDEVTDRGGKVVIYSSDSDLHPLAARPNVTQIGNIPRQGLTEITNDVLNKKYKFPFEWIPLYLVLTGGHNGYCKVKGIGPVTATALLQALPVEMKELPLIVVLDHLIKNVRLPRIPDLETHRSMLMLGLALQTFPHPSIDFAINPVPLTRLPLVTESMSREGILSLLEAKVNELSYALGEDSNSIRPMYTSVKCFLEYVCGWTGVHVPAPAPASTEVPTATGSTGINWAEFA